MRTVKQMICAGGFQQIVLGQNNEVLELRHEERFFNRRQRRAMAARDGGCVIPGCTAPPAWTEGHHVIPWVISQKTDISNGVLLCWYHHHSIETSGWKLRMVNGSPQVKAPPWLDPTRTWRPGGQHRASASTSTHTSPAVTTHHPPIQLPRGAYTPSSPNHPPSYAACRVINACSYNDRG